MKQFGLLIILSVFLTAGSLHARDRIALLDLTQINMDEKTVRAIEENLITEIVNYNVFDVVERSQLNKVLKELNLQNTEDFNEEQAVQIGKQLGVKVVLLGSVTKIGSSITINIRGIEVETGLAKIGHNVSVKDEEDLADAVSKLAAIITGKTSMSNSDSDRNKTKTVKKDKKTENKTAVTDPKGFTAVNKAGIGMIIGGSVVLLSGAAVFIVDNAYIYQQKTTAKTYEDYQNLHTADMAMFSSGIALMSVGAITAGIGIPLAVYKPKNVTLEFTPGPVTSVSLVIRF